MGPFVVGVYSWIVASQIYYTSLLKVALVPFIKGFVDFRLVHTFLTFRPEKFYDELAKSDLWSWQKAGNKHLFNNKLLLVTDDRTWDQ